MSDMELIKEVSKEVKSLHGDIHKKFKEISEGMTEMKNRGIKEVDSDFHNNFMQLKSEADKLIKRVDDIEAKDARPQLGGNFTETLAKSIAESKSYKDFVNGDTKNYKLDLKDITNLGSSSTQTMNALSRFNSIGRVANNPLIKDFVYDLLPHYPVTSDSMYLPTLQSFSDLSAPVAEGANKPQSDAVFAERRVLIETIAHWARMSKQSLADSDFLAAFIEQKLLNLLKFRVENQIFNGTGVSPQLTGLLLPTQSTVYAGGTATTLLDRVRWAMNMMEGQIATTAFYYADGVAMSPANIYALETLKSTDGKYLLNTDPTKGLTHVWGLRVLKTASLGVAVNTSVVGAFGSECAIFDREMPNIIISTEDASNVTQNKVTVLAETRVGFATFDNRAFVRAV